MKAHNTLIAVSLMILYAGSARADGQLFIYDWTDYTPPELVAKFEKETGIKVTIDTYDSNETLLAKLKAGGTGYDIANVTSSWVPVFIQEGLIQKIDLPEMEGFSNIDPRWQRPDYDANREFTGPYMWGFTSFDVNTNVYSGDIDTLKVLFEPPPELDGNISMLNSPSEVATLAQTYLGLPFCDTNIDNLKKVQDLLVKQSKSVKVYNSDGTIERLLSGEVAMSMGWNGNFVRAREGNPALKMAFPREGVTAWADNIVIPSGAKNVENAKIYINFLLQPENIAIASNYTSYANTIPAAEPFLNESLRTAPELKLPENIKARFLETCSEEATRLLDRIWTRVKQ